MTSNILCTIILNVYGSSFKINKKIKKKTLFSKEIALFLLFFPTSNKKKSNRNIKIAGIEQHCSFTKHTREEMTQYVFPENSL